MSLTLLTVYCDREDCIYNQEKRCSTTGIEVDAGGFCETYEKEELPAYRNPDAERN